MSPAQHVRGYSCDDITGPTWNKTTHGKEVTNIWQLFTEK